MKIYYYSLLLFLLCPLALQSQSEVSLIEQHLRKITKTASPRNYQNLNSLNEVADYLLDYLAPFADTSYFQEYEVQGKTYKNVVAVLGDDLSPTIVIGAHYDVCGNQEGADDNASGVVGLLELARLLKGKKLNHRIELVAYSLEEPPYFRSENMGSYIHAQSIKASGREVYGMLCLEMIGYFDSAKKTQDYPLGFLSWFYGTRGDYIALVNKFGKGKFSRKFNRGFMRVKKIRTKKIAGPKALQGIDFSDHLNYWALGYSAVMITDTAFYRNKNYHEKTDTMETLDLVEMAKVIDSVYETILQLR